MAESFDELVDEYTFDNDEEETFDTLVDQYQHKQTVHPFFEKAKDYAKTIAKGTVEGVSRFGKMMGPLQHESKTGTQELLEQTEILDEALPTSEGYVQKGIRRGLRELPTNLSIPGGGATQTAVRTGLAGMAGQAVEETGGPEWLQAAAELTAYVGPDLTKKLLSFGKDGDLIKQAKKLGLTDEQITPLLNAGNKRKWLKKIAPKRGKTQEALRNTYEALGEAYEGIRKSPEALKPASRESAREVITDLGKILMQDLDTTQRNKIMEDFMILMNQEPTVDSIIGFYQKINSTFGRGNKKIQLLKDPIKKFIARTDKNLAKDFDLINDLFSRYYNVSSSLSPTLTSDIIGASENVALLGSMVTGYYPGILGILKEKGARKIAQQLLINPRFQQLSQKLGNAILENKFIATKKLISEYADELAKTDKEAANMLKNISDEEIQELFGIQ